MALIMFTSGRGPEECEFAVSKFFDLFISGLRNRQIDYEVVSENKTKFGYLSIILSVNTTDECLNELKNSWNGILKLIYKSKIRENHQRKNWFVGCFFLDDLKKEIVLDEKDLLWETMKASGPGGQNVNKVESAVRLTHLPTGIQVVSRTERSQNLNKNKALKWIKILIQKLNHDNLENYKKDNQNYHDLERGNAIKTIKI